MTTRSPLTRRSLQTLLVSLALGLTGAIGGAAQADDPPPLTANQRSILLEESKLAPDGKLADWSDIEVAEADDAVALTANQRSILLEESKLAADGRLAAWSDIEAALADSQAAVPMPGNPHVTAF